MQYIFKTEDIWHVYEKREQGWSYAKLQQVSGEVIDREGEELPGPLGRLDMLQELENQLKVERAELQKQQKLQKELEEANAQQKQEFEKAYAELQKLAEQMQEEGRLWRQRYLDLAYQVSPKGK